MERRQYCDVPKTVTAFRNKPQLDLEMLSELDGRCFAAGLLGGLRGRLQPVGRLSGRDGGPGPGLHGGGAHRHAALAGVAADHGASGTIRQLLYDLLICQVVGMNKSSQVRLVFVDISSKGVTRLLECVAEQDESQVSGNSLAIAGVNAAILLASVNTPLPTLRLLPLGGANSRNLKNRVQKEKYSWSFHTNLETRCNKPMILTINTSEGKHTGGTL